MRSGAADDRRPTCMRSTCRVWGTLSARGVLGLPAQQVARLALEHLAERGQRREAHGLGAAVLEYSQVGGRDPYAVRELADGHLPFGQHHVDVDGDRHQITSS